MALIYRSHLVLYLNISNYRHCLITFIRLLVDYCNLQHGTVQMDFQDSIQMSCQTIHQYTLHPHRAIPNLKVVVEVDLEGVEVDHLDITKRITEEEEEQLE